MACYKMPLFNETNSSGESTKASSCLQSLKVPLVKKLTSLLIQFTKSLIYSSFSSGNQENKVGSTSIFRQIVVAKLGAKINQKIKTASMT